LKLRDGGGLFSRPEWEWTVAGDEPNLALLKDTPAARFVETGKSSARIGSRFTVRIERRTWNVESEGGEIEIVLDEGEAVCGARRDPICEVELELKKGGARGLFELARKLGSEVPLRLGVRSKAERGYALAKSARGKTLSTKAEPLALSSGMDVAEAFAAIVQACLRHFRLNAPWVEAEREPGALHQARVAMRRLRSALTLFGPALRDSDFERLRQELRWFTDQLGEARNLDVFSARLPKRRGAEIGKAEEAVRAKLAAARSAAYDRVVEALRSQRLRTLILDLAEWAETGEWREAKEAGRPLDGFAQKQVAKRWRKVREAAPRLRSLDPEPLHRLRIDIKKLRYAIEFFSGLAQSKSEMKQRSDFIAALAVVQDELGAINDMETARALVSRLGFERPSEQRFAERLAESGGDPASHIEAAEPQISRLFKLTVGEGESAADGGLST
jgi:inorganic triphosphatase YgiF